MNSIPNGGDLKWTFHTYAPLWGEALLTVLAVLIVLLGSLMKNSGKLMAYLSAWAFRCPGLVGSNLIDDEARHYSSLIPYR